MPQVREPAVADYFYPGNPDALRDAVLGYLRAGTSEAAEIPKAIVAPHAGYIYSGPIAASAYRLVSANRGRITRVLLLGPAHRVYLNGIAMSGCNQFRTPLGDVEIDADAYAQLADMPHVRVAEQAHEYEHSLEVHVPFLQTVLGEGFKLVPLVVGQAEPGQVAEVLACVWGGEETLVVVSSDLSHYHDYDTARRVDAQTTEAIEALDYARIGSADACGCFPLKGLLRYASENRLRVQTLDVRNSGDTAGSRDRVVGYGAYAFFARHDDSVPA